MSRAARSLFVFGHYLCVLGAFLLFLPNVLLRFFGARATNEVWIRINGMFIICLAVFHVGAARHELTLSIRWTVWAGVAVIFYLTTFVVLINARRL